MGLIHIGDLHKHAFYPSYTEFVYPGCWHFEKGATCNIDDVPIEHGVLPHILTLTVHLIFIFGGQVEGTILNSLSFFPSCLKVKMGTNWVLELIKTWLGLVLGGF